MMTTTKKAENLLYWWSECVTQGYVVNGHATTAALEAASNLCFKSKPAYYGEIGKTRVEVLDRILRETLSDKQYVQAQIIYLPANVKTDQRVASSRMSRRSYYRLKRLLLDCAFIALEKVACVRAAN